MTLEVPKGTHGHHGLELSRQSLNPSPCNHQADRSTKGYSGGLGLSDDSDPALLVGFPCVARVPSRDMQKGTCLTNFRGSPLTPFTKTSAILVLGLLSFRLKEILEVQDSWGCKDIFRKEPHVASFACCFWGEQGLYYDLRATWKQYRQSLESVAQNLAQWLVVSDWSSARTSLSSRPFLFYLVTGRVTDNPPAAALVHPWLLRTYLRWIPQHPSSEAAHAA